MAVGRAAPAAARLPDGDVLIAGGNSEHGLLDSAELFDPTTGSFSALSGAMTTARGWAAAVPLASGEVLIVGGSTLSSAGSPLASAELFDPTTATFSALSGSMTTPREGLAAARLPDGDVLIAGGNSEHGLLDSAELFDPATGAFSATGSMTTARELAVAAPLPNGEVLVAGGENGSRRALSSAELFNPATDTFAAVSSARMTTGRESAAAAPLRNGDVLIVGGYNHGVLASAELFNPATDTFSALSSVWMGTARDVLISSPLPHGRVLIAGGFNSSVLASAEVFRPAPQATSADGVLGGERAGASHSPKPHGVEVTIARPPTAHAPAVHAPAVHAPSVKAPGGRGVSARSAVSQARPPVADRRLASAYPAREHPRAQDRPLAIEYGRRRGHEHSPGTPSRFFIVCALGAFLSVLGLGIVSPVLSEPYRLAIAGVACVLAPLFAYPIGAAGYHALSGDFATIIAMLGLGAACAFAVVFTTRLWQLGLAMPGALVRPLVPRLLGLRRLRRQRRARADAGSRAVPRSPPDPGRCPRCQPQRRLAARWRRRDRRAREPGMAGCMAKARSGTARAISGRSREACERAGRRARRPTSPGSAS
jgi:hypothetical protein